MPRRRRNKGISRIDQPAKRTHGWYVRVSFDYKTYSKFFTDEKHGGKERALEKAIRFRNRVEREVGKPRTDRRVVVNSPRNSTGIVGIQRKVKATPTKSGEVTYHNLYEVTWNPKPNVIRRTSVSIDTHGEERAFRKAYRIRKEKEREMYGSIIKFKRK